MALVTRVDAAMRLGVSLELLDWFVKKSPKRDRRKLITKNVDGELYFDDEELRAFQKYLHDPWPKPANGGRPHIPEALKEDIRAECHYSCAICGNMNNGEVAHIDAVADTLNNGPDNLVLLCPNHHTQYDNGFKPSNNVTRAAVLAAKEVKRNTRRRLMKVEANVTKCFLGTISMLKQLEAKLQASGTTKDEAEVYATEVKRLLETVPKMSQQLQELGRADQSIDDVTKLLAAKAPHLAKAATGAMPKQSEVRSAARSVLGAVEEALIELDEVECPHCGGRGQIGLVGDLCSYCKGSCYVSEDDANRYDPVELDEVECPRCAGRGQTGLVGDLCAFCKGSCVVSRAVAEQYDESDIDEIECPRCFGRGTTGLSGDVCAYCHGSCYVSRERAESYDPEELDEVDCPHCGGRGTTGLVGDVCAFCTGSCFVSRARAAHYDADKLDEVACPRCGGAGTTGLVGNLCKLCKGSTVVTRALATAYENKYGR
jgi:DnaJ-class molecular chaperone